MKKALILMVAGYIIFSLLDMYIMKTREPHWRCEDSTGKDI